LGGCLLSVLSYLRRYFYVIITILIYNLLFNPIISIFTAKMGRLARKTEAITAQANFIKSKIFLKLYTCVRYLKFIIKPGGYDCQKYVYPARGQKCAWCAKNNYFCIKIRVNCEQPESRHIVINAYFKLFLFLLS